MCQDPFEEKRIEAVKHSRRALAAALATSLSLSLPAPAEAQQLSSSPEFESLLARYAPGVDPEQVRALGVLAALVASIAIAIPMVKNGKVTSPSREHTHTLQVDGRNRTYDVVLPRSFDSEKSYPVVLGFGGWQHTSRQMHDYARLESQFPDAIVVYGQGVNNAWGGAPYADTSIDEDVAYTKAVLDDVASRYHADTSRTVAVGLSNGGGMVAALACHAPETVRGVASVAGAFYSPTVTGCTSGEVPTLIMHGTNDDVVGYNGGTRHGAPFRSVDNVARTFARKNDCFLLTTQSRSGSVTNFDFVGCAEPVRIERVEGGGHTWFTSPDATRETAQFLRRFL